jgi:hypothetical protein
VLAGTTVELTLEKHRHLKPGATRALTLLMFDAPSDQVVESSSRRVDLLDDSTTRRLVHSK